MTDTPQTDQPSTAAGRALLRSLDEALTSLPRSAYEPAILAIEAEARADTARLVPTITPDYDVVWEPNEADTARPVEPPDQAAQIAAAEERAARWKGNHDYQVSLKRKQHGMIVALREALEAVYSNAPNWFEMVEAALNDTAQAAAEAVAEIEERAVHEFAAMLLAHPAITNLLAYGASPPEYPDLALVPKSDLDAFRALLTSVSQEGEGA